MKKIIASAVGLMMFSGVAVTGAMAAESQFGGYWRTRAFIQDDFNQDGSFSRTDTRTRLYYTAKFNDHFKFVNKLEFNTLWGNEEGGGGIGADGDNLIIQNSYVDYTMGMINTKVGIQAAVISRGFIFDENFSGAVVTADMGNFQIPVLYAAAVDDDVDPTADGDVHLLSAMPTFKISDAMVLTPHVTYLSGTSDIDEEQLWLGADIDMKYDAASAWGTFIYNNGEVGTADNDGFLVAAGASAGIVHGQAFYADDEFVSAPGSSYYWSEIMGLGVFDNAASAGSPGGDITDVWAVNVGVTLKPMDKLTANFDVWYAELSENDADGDDELGLEFDAKVTYALEENLNLDFVFAYLVAGDATGDDDVMEGGVRVSLAF